MISKSLYYLFAKGLQFSLSCARFFNKKAKLAYEGRKNWKENSAYQSPKDKKVFWMHVSSLGEFEQGRPVLELFRKAKPEWHIVLTFFSPSGYEIRKNYPEVDAVLYLPLDSSSNARIFLEKVRPTIAVFVKYDFWYYFLKKLRTQQVPTLLIAAKFRAGQPFFKFWGGLWHEMLQCFTMVSTQEHASVELLEGIGYKNAQMHGDPRIDRVLSIANSPFQDEKIEAFSQNAKVIAIGSAWNSDVKILDEEYIFTTNHKLLIAPHEISETNIAFIERKFQGATRYTQATIPEMRESKVLILDTIGMLNKVYRFGHIAYIGGGFGSGIHNTLEPSAYGLPILIGPKFQKFEEAVRLTETKGAFVVHSTDDFNHYLEQLSDVGFYKKTQNAVQTYLSENKGASQKILEILLGFEKE